MFIYIYTHTHQGWCPTSHYSASLRMFYTYTFYSKSNILQLSDGDTVNLVVCNVTHAWISDKCFSNFYMEICPVLRRSRYTQCINLHLIDHRDSQSTSYIQSLYAVSMVVKLIVLTWVRWHNYLTNCSVYKFGLVIGKTYSVWNIVIDKLFSAVIPN